MIEVKNAVMRFDDKNALDGVSLTIPEGCAYRSEERRVGKECRSRWSPDH